MAKRAKSKDAPAIIVKVEGGRLVAVSAFDAELLGQWRDGAILSIEPVLTQQRPLERAYFAMLTKLLQVAETPWTNVVAAHDAIKLATGFVEPYRRKDKNKGWGFHPRHIATFTDTELAEFHELFCGIVQRRFGVDPETLRKEALDTEFAESSHGQVTSRADDAPSADPIPAGAGVPISDAVLPNPDSSEGPEADGGGAPTSPRQTTSSSAEGRKSTHSAADLSWMKMAARMLVQVTQPGGGMKEAISIDRAANFIKDYHTPPEITAKARAITKQVYVHCLDACIDSKPFDKQWVAKLAQCTVADLEQQAEDVHV